MSRNSHSRDVPRKVADTPLARAVLELVKKYGSDEKLATEIGAGASRFTVMRWRAEGMTPEKPAYVERLIELGVDAALIDHAGEDELASRRSLTQRVERLEGDVSDLTTALAAARESHTRLLRRVSELEKAAQPQDAQRAQGSKRRGQTGR